MWKAAKLVDGTWSEVDVVELGAEPFSTRLARSIARERFPGTRFLRYLEQEAETTPAATHDAIESWSRTAVEAASEFDWDGPAVIAAVDEALGLYRRDEAREPNVQARASTLAWHDRTGAIIPLGGNEERVLVEYVPNLRDAIRVDRLRHRYATPEHALETLLDWRGYFGHQSALIDGWTVMRKRGHGFIASIKGTFGYVVTSVLRRLSHDAPTFDRDPTARARLVNMCERYPHIANAFPDLSTIDPQVCERAIVFVHGTVSCGIQGLKDLYPALVPMGTSVSSPILPIYRFEHDTFERIQDNACTLAKLITERLKVPHLLLAAHSRGGLVARMTIAKLERDRYPGQLSLYTFGTPHAGTPLVAIGAKALNMLYKLGEDMAGAIPVVSPLAKAYSYVYDAPSLPRGIEAMREDSDFYDAMGFIGTPRNARAWGSDFDVDKAASGFGVTVEGGLIAAFADRFHDLVVPSASALAFGTPEPRLNCSHAQYLVQGPIQTAIRDFVQPATPISAAGVQNSTANDVQVFADHVIIGGVRLPRRKWPSEGAASHAAPTASPLASSMATTRPVRAMKPVTYKRQAVKRK